MGDTEPLPSVLFCSFFRPCKANCASAADYTQLVLNTNLLTSTATGNSQVTSVRTVLSRVSHNISKQSC